MVVLRNGNYITSFMNKPVMNMLRKYCSCFWRYYNYIYIIEWLQYCNFTITILVMNNINRKTLSFLVWFVFYTFWFVHFTEVLLLIFRALTLASLWWRYVHLQATGLCFTNSYNICCSLKTSTKQTDKKKEGTTSLQVICYSHLPGSSLTS